MPEPASTTIPLEQFTHEARSLIAAAQALADEQKHADVEPIHLLSRAVRDPGVVEILKKTGADPGEVGAACEAALKKMPKATGGEAYLSEALLELLRRAERESKREKAAQVGLEQVLVALSQEIRGAAGEVFGAFNLTPGFVRPHLGLLRSVPRDAVTTGTPGGSTPADLVGRYTRDLVAASKGADPVIGRDGEVRRLLQILERRSKNHPLLVGEPGVGKSAILRALALRIAGGEVPANLNGARLLELDSGAIVAGATKVRGEVEDRIKALAKAMQAERGKAEAILVIDNLDGLLGQGVVGAGMGDVLKSLFDRGELRVIATCWPEGLKKLAERDAALFRRFTTLGVEAASNAQALEILQGIVPRYEQHHNVAIAASALDAAVKLAARYVQDRALPDSAIDLLDETAARKRVESEGVPAEVDNLLRRLDSLKAQRNGIAHDNDRTSAEQRDRIEQEIRTLEPQVAALRSKIEARRGAQMAADALRREVQKLEAELDTARKEKPARAGELEYVILPQMRQRYQAALAVVESNGPGPSNLVAAEDVAHTLETWTGIPVQKMLEGESDKLLKMETRLRLRVVGQDEAVNALSRAVRRGRIGLRDPRKPIGSFLFLGPSGVGKTELAKALAEFLFDDEQAMTRLDMSEFMERHMAQRLLGAPPGYVDSEQGGFLTEAVRRRPYSVLLFDEIEKAHGDVFNLLLQVLDDGRLTDGRGRLADFSNTVIIMTSNVGSGRILDTDPRMFESEEGRGALGEVLMSELKEKFRPEFLNRIGDVIVFRPLRKTDLRGIVDIQLRRVNSLVESRRISLRFTDAAKDRLVEISYEPAFGARPLNRSILRHIQDPLAENILKAGYREGTTLTVDIRGEQFTFEG
ncbi:MAG: ATP-dependent Clp protease ATP-binding subunit [Polyangiaceae bacterium]|jgi:ATP-dependent Clp protease ATP-binding subunit ClpB|nr:ATP-dependent Clp protease ATP-binding subunit [Polyangiaceae bacterium]